MSEAVLSIREVKFLNINVILWYREPNVSSSSRVSVQGFCRCFFKAAAVATQEWQQIPLNLMGELDHPHWSE